MPVLPVEAYQFPEDAFPGRDAPKQTWWLLHTRPRAEKAVARALYAARISFFLPVFPKKRKVRKRLQTSQNPLFSGYLFLHGTANDRLIALDTNKLVSCTPIVDTQRIQSELEAIYRVMHSQLEFGPETSWVPGTPVKILHGPLAGIEGSYRRTGRQPSIVIEVRMLNRGVYVELEPWMVSPSSKA